MPPKRKAGLGAQSAKVKSGRTSKQSTPGPVTPRSVEETPAASDADDDVLDDEGVEEEQKQREAAMVEGSKKFVNILDLEKYARGRPRDAPADAATSFFGSDGKYDYLWLRLKPDHRNRPLFIDQERGLIILERFSPLADQATDFLVTIGEPKSRPAFLHEYGLTAHSLYAAVSIGLHPQDIINTLNRFLKTPMPPGILKFIQNCASQYGKVKLVLKHNRYFVESADPELLQELLRDPVIGRYRVQGSDDVTTTTAPKMAGLVIPGTKEARGIQQAGLQQGAGVAKAPKNKEANGDKAGDKNGGAQQDREVLATLNEEDDDDDDDTEAVHSFEIAEDAVEIVQRRCLEIQKPMLSEYDFRNDDVNANLEIDLRPNTQIRPYQEKSLSKMFGNGRAKSGIIVLPCGAGKTLVGITAACTVRKGVIVLCTSAMSVVQWRNEFLKWSNINPDDIAVLTADQKERFQGNTGIIVTTYSMVTNRKKMAHDTEKVMKFLREREWGLMLLDEVHVVPAEMFRRVLASIKSHSKLGLTATLLREDDKIGDLNFLIGPKLYEANWMELSQKGHIAKVQCAEVWCPMPTEFYDEYLRATHRLKRTLYAMNPRKFQACQYLIDYHERRGDKIIVFSDELYPLQAYAEKLQKYYIYGNTPQQERMRLLANFQYNDEVNTLFLSKIGDTSLDLPEATCLIQISSHFGSRRQEAQRLGRILRAKRRNDEGFNAFFYSLVSKDTQEMYYSSKRQAFLVDQGYAFKVITQLKDMEKMPDLAYATASERRELLQKVLVDNEKPPEEDIIDDDLFGNDTGHRKRGAGRRGGGGPLVRRTAGTMSDLSGAGTMAYVEQNKAKRLTKKDKEANRSSFMKAQMRDVKRTKEQNAKK